MEWTHLYDLRAITLTCIVCRVDPQSLPSAGGLLRPDAEVPGPVGEHLARVHVGDGRPELCPPVLGSEKIQLARDVRAENTNQILKELQGVLWSCREKQRKNFYFTIKFHQQL